MILDDSQNHGGYTKYMSIGTNMKNLELGKLWYAKYTDQKFYARYIPSPSKKCIVPPKGKNPSKNSIFWTSQQDKRGQKGPRPPHQSGGGANYGKSV